MVMEHSQLITFQGCFLLVSVSYIPSILSWSFPERNLVSNMLRLKSANITLHMEIPDDSETNLGCVRYKDIRPNSPETITTENHCCFTIKKKTKQISSGIHCNAYQYPVPSFLGMRETTLPWSLAMRWGHWLVLVHEIRSEKPLCGFLLLLLSSERSSETTFFKLWASISCRLCGVEQSTLVSNIQS